MIDIGSDTGWCIAGRYEMYDKPKGVCKVSQAKQYFNDYMKTYDLNGYYVIIHNGVKDCLLVDRYGEINSLWDMEDNSYEDDDYDITSILTNDYKIPLKVFGIKDWSKETYIYKGYGQVPHNVVRVRIDDTVTEISELAFYDCKSLKQINIPNSVTEIYRNTFMCCESLEQITIPNNVTKISKAAFNYCKSLKQISIPKHLEGIKFENCNAEIIVRD